MILSWGRYSART